MAQDAGPAGPSTSATENDDLREIFRNVGPTTDMDPGVWIPKLRNKIVTMLKAPLKQEFNAEVYRCIFQLCMFKKRFTWLCSDETRWSREEAKHFSMITRLSLNELHILLPLIKRHLETGDQVEMENEKVMSRPASTEEYHQFDVHLFILEDTIQALVRDQDDDGHEQQGVNSMGAPKLTDSMEPNEIKSLLERMKEVLSEIFEYLESVHKHWLQLVAKPNSLEFGASLGALRIALMWVSEDIGSFQTQCENFFIDLIVKYLMAIKVVPDTMPDLLVMGLDAIRLSDEGLRNHMFKVPHYRDALQGYLDFIQREQLKSREKETSSTRKGARRRKEFKFRCAMIKDLLEYSQE